MKQILSLFILLAIFKTTIAQTNDTAKYNPKTYGYGWVYNRIKLDSGIIIPRIGDTTSKTKGQLRILGNNLCWVGNDGTWHIAGGSSSVPTLNSVLTAGNISHLGAYIDTLGLYDLAADSYTKFIGSDGGFAVKDYSDQIILQSQIDALSIYNSGGFIGGINVGSITANRNWAMPDSSAKLLTAIKANGSVFTTTSTGLVDLGTLGGTPGIDDVLAQAQSLTTNRSIVTGLNNKFSILNTSDLGETNYYQGGGNGGFDWRVKNSSTPDDSIRMTLSPDGNTFDINNFSNSLDVNASFRVNTSGIRFNTNKISTSEQINFSLEDNTAIFTDGRTTPTGIEYFADYSATYTDRSLVDKAYVLANAGVPYTGATGNLDLGTNSYLGASYSAYNTSDHTTNYERGRLYYNSNVLTLVSEAGGTGTVRNLRIDAGTGSLTFNAPGAYNFLNSAATTTFSGTAQALSYLSNATTGNGLQFINTGLEITNVVNFANRAAGTTTNGSNLLLAAQGASSGGTNLDGGDVQIKSGTSTGNAQSKIQFYTPDISGSGTTDNAPVLRAEFNKDGLYVKTITDGTAGTDSLVVESAGQFKKVSPTHYGTGNALTTNPLSQFAATTSAQLAGVLTDETGTGSVVYSSSPTLVTPALGTPSALVLTNATGLPENGIVRYTKTHYGTSFATSNTIALSTTNYLAITASGSANVTENNRLWIVPETGTLRNLYVGISGTQSATGSLVFTIRQGTVGSLSDTGFTLTIPAGSTAGVYSNTGSTLSVTAGDVLSYKVVNNATATSAPIVVTAIIMTN